MSSEGVRTNFRRQSVPRIHTTVEAKRINVDEDMPGIVPAG